jgi:hypothetical protein
MESQPRKTWISWIERHSALFFILLVAAGSLRIVATYPVLSHTIDEPLHIACGMEWLDNGTYRFWAEQPPLSRVAAALGPYLAGRRNAGGPAACDFAHPMTVYERGNAILWGDHRYDRNLALARLGVLPFFWIASIVVYLWSKRCFGEPAAALAVFLFTFLPPILAHAGLATTDMALTAFTGAAFLSSLVWVENPGWAHSLMFGTATGLAVLSKFSALAFLPASLLAALIGYLTIARPRLSRLAAAVRRRALPLCLAALTGFVVIWAGYRFSFDKVDFTSVRLPAPELYAGIRQVLEHNRAGHLSYFLGRRGQYGWWYYYLVVLGVKTPLAFLILLFVGVVGCFRRLRGDRYVRWLPLAFSLGILLVSLNSRINIGVRHVLPVYMGFSIVAAGGGVWLRDLSRRRPLAGWTLGALLLWLAASSASSHPDYIPYFNVLAGNQPERIVVDSDLDWGQDVKRVGKRLRELGASSITYIPFYYPSLGAEVPGLPPYRAGDPLNPSPGWNVVSLSTLKEYRLGYAGPPEIQAWPERIEPMERIGKTTWMYHFAPE